MPIRALHKLVVSDFDALGIAVRKTSNETVTSSTTLQNDDQLMLPVAASAVYIMDAVIFYSGHTANLGGLKLGWTGPSGATMRWNNFANNFGVAPAETQYNISSEPIGGTPRGIGTIGAGNIAACRPSGTLAVSTTSGNLQLQWAQWLSNAVGTIVHADSVLRLFRIA